MVKQIEKSMESIDFGDITKPVGFTVTLNYQNDGKVAFSKTFTVDPSTTDETIRASARLRGSLLPVRLLIDACRRKAVLSYPEGVSVFIPAGLVDSVSIAIFTKIRPGRLPANDPNLKIQL